MAANKVTKCICHDRSFEEVRDFARKNNLSTVDALQEKNFCSNSCRLCAPYVAITLETGQTEFTPGEPFRKSS